MTDYNAQLTDNNVQLAAILETVNSLPEQGPGPKPEEERSIRVTQNGTTYVEPTPGSVMTKVTVETEVAGKPPALQVKTVTPTKAQQQVGPDAGFDGLSQVMVAAIPAKYPDVSGDTVTANDMPAGVTAHDSAGNPIEGNAIEIKDGFTWQSQRVYSQPAGGVKVDGGVIRGASLMWRGTAIPSIEIPADAMEEEFGNATVADVTAGKFFTSAAGLRVEGQAAGGGGIPTPVTPGDTAIQADWGYHSTSDSAAEVKVSTITVARDGRYKVRWIVGQQTGGFGTIDADPAAQLYVDNVAKATAALSATAFDTGLIQETTLTLTAGQVVSMGLKAGSQSRWGGQVTPIPVACSMLALCISL